MQNPQSSPEWAAEDTAALRNFLSSQTGTRLLDNIAAAQPALLPGGDTNAIMIRSGELRGAQHVLTTIFGLAYPPKETADKPAETYPALTDDEAWADGNKLKDS